MSEPSGSAAPEPDDDLLGTEPDDTEAAEQDGLEELRQAAGAVLASLKWLVDAAERVVEDPRAFDQVVATGRGLVEAFTSGFTAERSAPGADEERDETL